MEQQTFKTPQIRKKIKGVKVPDYKNTYESTTMDIPDIVIIPMQQHSGTPCKSLVKPGDLVKVGQKIGDTDRTEEISAPIHSSVSGKIKEISKIVTLDGFKVDAIVIESDGKQGIDESIRIPEINSTQDFINAIRDSGLVGLGGAGFPAHVKLASSVNRNVDYLLINAAECEPYITSDDSECMENTDTVIFGALSVAKYLEIKNIVIAIENNKMNAINKLNDYIENINNSELKSLASQINFKVFSLETNYPQGAEKILIYNVLGRKVELGQLPRDVGVLVMNVSSVSFVGKYLKTGMPLISRKLTVDGDCIAKPANIIVPIGSRICDVINACGGLTETPGKILYGGPMMGIAVFDDKLPITKQNNAILALSQRMVDSGAKEIACIRCGRCVANCPMSLLPCTIMDHYRKNHTDALSELGVKACIECGCCSYVCPSKIPVTQYMKLAKRHTIANGDKSESGKEAD